MHSFTVIAASALLATVSGSPLFARGNTCGVAPSGSAQNQPIAQPTGIKTSADCQAQCNAKSGCQSFCFGMVDNTIQCKLYSCDASAIPKQSSTNLIAYGKACSAVPSVVPTSSNPTGKADNQKASGNNQKASDNKLKSTDIKQKSTGSQTNESKGTESKASQPKAQESKVTEPKAKESKVTEPKAKETKATSSGQQQQQQSSANQQKGTSKSANTCGSKPAGNSSNLPIATPNVSSADLCKAQCQANSNCKSFTCGSVNNAMKCELYSCEASAIPAPSDSAKKSAFKAYDVGCSM